MSRVMRQPIRGEQGMALVTSMLLLAVVTILALGMFRSFGVQEQIAGNLREKQRALHAAENAQQYAEWWLSSANNAASGRVLCDSVLNANLSQGQICTLPPTNITSPPLQTGGVDVGVTYNPGNTMTVATSAARDTYYAVPRFYIAYAGPSADASGDVYQIDAVGYGGTASAVAVVESTFVVKTGVVDRGCP
jgi:type IV pilus assembly protein PilX